jgi:hypothetical protein
MPSVSTPPTPCTQHVPPNHGTYSCLRRTHVHYPIRSCPCLVPYGCAAASYHVPLTRSSMTHSSPFSTIHLPHLVCFLIPVYVKFHLHQRPYASFFDPVLYLASFTVSPFVPSFRLRPFPVYKPLSRRLCLSSLTWSLIPSLVQCSHCPLVCSPVRTP